MLPLTGHFMRSNYTGASLKLIFLSFSLSTWLKGDFNQFFQNLCTITPLRHKKHRVRIVHSGGNRNQMSEEFIASKSSQFDETLHKMVERNMQGVVRQSRKLIFSDIPLFYH